MADHSGMDPRTSALVRIAGLVALDAPAAAYRAEVSSAVEEGITDDDLVEVLRSLAPIVGAPRVATAASHVVAALGPTHAPLLPEAFTTEVARAGPHPEESR